ncbi:hypothetical protein L6R53_10435 [Myxococcota bacterium]|nr:hypothetical protein [Myxococcota bacterium]
MNPTLTTRPARSPLARLALPAVLGLSACELAEPIEVMGNFAVSYADNMRIYINDELVAEVTPGQEAQVEYNGEIFQVSALCGEEGTLCPSESYWREAAVDQPWGPDYKLLNFVNLDLERGVPGQRMGGTMQDDRSFAMLSGLQVGANELCAAIGVGTVTGRFSPDGGAIEEGVITYEWAGGCDLGDGVGVAIRLETDYTASRTGDYDVSAVTPEQPIDEEGEPVDPEEPEDGYEVEAMDARLR